MKKFLVLIALILVNIGSLGSLTALAEPTNSYGLILVETPLYRESVEEFDVIENIFFILPDSYFVIIKESEDENGLISCEYDGFTGFVLLRDIEIVDYEPRFVFPDPVTLTLKGEITGLRLRQTPDNSQKEILVIPESAGSIRYYSYLDGQDLDGSGNRWYFVSYQQSFGYVYNGYVVIEEVIPQNTIEAVVPVVPEEPPQSNPSIVPPSKISDYIFIGILCLPIILIIALLFRGGKPKYYTRPQAPRPPKYLDE